MVFEEDKRLERFGRKVGFVFSYFLFVTILFFAIEYWSYLYSMGVGFLVVIIGAVIAWLLK